MDRAEKDAIKERTVVRIGGVKSLDDMLKSIIDGTTKEREVIAEVESWETQKSIIADFAVRSFFSGYSNIEEGDWVIPLPFSTRFGAEERIEIGITTRLSDIRAMKIRSFVLAVKAENRLYSDMIWLLQFQTEYTEEDIDEAFGYERNKGFAFC